jgi:hypothetical protein
VNSHARSASAANAKTPSVGVRGVGCVAAISVGVAMRSRRRFWITAEKERDVRACVSGGNGHTDEGQVDDLEQPRWEFGAKDDPAVVLIVARNEQRSA